MYLKISSIQDRTRTEYIGFTININQKLIYLLSEQCIKVLHAIIGPSNLLKID